MLEWQVEAAKSSSSNWVWLIALFQYTSALINPTHNFFSMTLHTTRLYISRLSLVFRFDLLKQHTSSIYSTIQFIFFPIFLLFFQSPTLKKVKDFWFIYRIDKISRKSLCFISYELTVRFYKILMQIGKKLKRKRFVNIWSVICNSCNPEFKRINWSERYFCQ